MRTLVWAAFALLLAVWTGAVALSAQMLDWLFNAVTQGQISDAAQAVGQWPIPAWLGVWVDTGLLESFQATWVVAVAWLADVLPAAGALTAWVVPLLWTAWGLVSLGLLAAAVTGHVLTGQRRGSPA